VAAIPLAVDGTETVGLSLRDDRIVDGKTRGYVSTLAVRPAWRKRGIAFALLQHTFAEFRRRGYAAVELDIDSQNLTGASRLCDRAGMRVVRQSVTYEKELRPEPTHDARPERIEAGPPQGQPVWFLHSRMRNCRTRPSRPTMPSCRRRIV